MDLNQAASQGHKNAMKPMVRNKPQKSKNGKPTAVDPAYRGYRIRRRKGKFQPPPTSSYPPDKTPPEIRWHGAESNTSVDPYESHDKVRGPRRTGGIGNTKFGRLALWPGRVLTQIRGGLKPLRNSDICPSRRPKPSAWLRIRRSKTT